MKVKINQTIKTSGKVKVVPKDKKPFKPSHKEKNKNDKKN